MGAFDQHRAWCEFKFPGFTIQTRVVSHGGGLAGIWIEADDGITPLQRLQIDVAHEALSWWVRDTNCGTAFPIYWGEHNIFEAMFLNPPTRGQWCMIEQEWFFEKQMEAYEEQEYTVATRVEKAQRQKIMENSRASIRRQHDEKLFKY